MLGQSKTVFQAEIDAAAELSTSCASTPTSPSRSGPAADLAAGAWNRIDTAALEGFVFAVTPFNFTSIGGNLPSAPALMGNIVLWKPASTAILSAWS